MNLKSRMERIQRRLIGNEGEGVCLLYPGGMIVSNGTEGKMRRSIVDWDGNPLSDDRTLYRYGNYSRTEVEAKMEELRKKKKPNEVWIIDDIPRGEEDED